MRTIWDTKITVTDDSGLYGRPDAQQPVEVDLWIGEEGNGSGCLMSADDARRLARKLRKQAKKVDRINRKKNGR